MCICVCTYMCIYVYVYVYVCVCILFANTNPRVRETPISGVWNNMIMRNSPQRVSKIGLCWPSFGLSLLDHWLEE